MVLNPKDYLTSQGWEGEGKGLQLNSRSKPITVLQKKNTFGIGKDRDHSYPWWDDVFKSVINKISVKKVNDDDTKDNQLELRRTETGIISHLPSLSPMIDLKKSNLNLDIINDAKRNEAIQNLYRNFRRGQLIEGTVEEVKPTNQASNQIQQDCSSSSSSSSNNASESVQIGSRSTDTDRTTMKEKKRRDRKEKKDKKERKEKKKRDKKDTTDTTDPKDTSDATNIKDTTDGNETIDLPSQKEKKEKKDKNEKKDKKDKKDRKESKLKSIKKVIIDEGLNQIFTLDTSNQPNERKLKRKSSKLDKNEAEDESRSTQKKKKKRKEEE